MATESVVDSALRRLSIFLLDERASSDKTEIQTMVKNLQDIQLSLKYAVARTDDKDVMLSAWEREVEDLAYRIEDSIDIFVIGGVRYRSKRAAGRLFNTFLDSIDSTVVRSGFNGPIIVILFQFLVANCISGVRPNYSLLSEREDIIAMKKQMDYIINMKDKMNFNEPNNLDPNNVENQNPLRSRYYIDDFTGMEEDVERLVSCIIGDDTHGQVISICGMGGTGKTSLAQKLFCDIRVQQHFQRFAWVSVSQRFQKADIWRLILNQLEINKRKEIDNVNDTELSYEIFLALKEIKCLIVLDDIWSMDDWKKLSVIFPFGQMASKIILTTRMREIGETVSGNKRFFHLMRTLTEEESWHLFAKKALSRNYQVDPQIEMIGKAMVNRCGGMPLAIVMLGGIMGRKGTLHEWKMVHEHIGAYLLRGEQVGDTVIHRALGLSYDNLPYFLKPCFLYFGLFPADSNLEAEKLYLLWVAEGFILPQQYGQEETSVDVAERYLGELVQQSLVEVQAEEVPMIRRFKSCQLNKLMQDLCLFKGKEENFLMVMDCESKKQQVSEFGASARRVMICKYEGRDVSCKHDLNKHLRCLLLRNVSGDEHESGLPVKISNLMELKLLRTLDFDGFDFRKIALPRGIDKLVCLRYLSFKRCFLEELPLSIRKLRSLQILDLRVRSLIKIRIASVLRNLKNLMHLFLPQSLEILDGNKLKLDMLTSLETLANFNTRVCNVGDLMKLVQLRCLVTTIEGSLEDLEWIIKRIYMTSEHILHSSLDIRNFDCYTEERQASFKQLLKCQSLFILHIQGKIDQIPPYQEISPCLMEIILDSSELEEDPMPILENLPSLRVLVLSNDAFVGDNMGCSASGFSELKRLELSNLHFLKKWEINAGAMPKLHRLTIKECEELAMVPKGLKFVTNLRELKIIGMPQSFEDRLRLINGKEGEDLHKVQHVHVIFEKKLAAN